MAHLGHDPSLSNPPEAKTEGVAPESDLLRYIDLKLAALGHPTNRHADSEFLELARPLLRNYHQKDIMLGNPLCPADWRIQAFLDVFLSDVGQGQAAQIPGNTFLLDRPGLA